MASNKMTPLFTWGDAVVLANNAPNRFAGENSGSICGIRTIDSESLAKEFGQSIGAVIYLVENGDGETIEVPEAYLQKLE